jgi:uncharacterized protein (TIGR02996 family)
MNQPAEAPFIQSIQADPRAATPRLVYADWLEEQGDPRSEYLRLEVQLSKCKRTGAKAKQLRRQMLELRPQIDELWLAEFEQPGMMLANLTLSEAAWTGMEMTEYRECNGTYGTCLYSRLPPLPVQQFRGNFTWLKKRKSVQDKDAQLYWQQEARHGMRWVSKIADSLGLTIPVAYRTFMSSPALFLRLRSPTDCNVNWPRRIVESPIGKDAYLLRFYADSQGCVYWYLYLHPSGYHAVVASTNFYGGYVPEEPDEEEYDEDEIFVTGDKAFQFCAPSFESFIYRTWIENEIWYAREWDYHTLSKEEEEYLSHYEEELNHYKNQQAEKARSKKQARRGKK